MNVFITNDNKQNPTSCQVEVEIEIPDGGKGYYHLTVFGNGKDVINAHHNANLQLKELCKTLRATESELNDKINEYLNTPNVRPHTTKTNQ
jgi:hypothetical protein